MLLDPQSAQRFIHGYSEALLEVLRQGRKKRSGNIISDLAVARGMEQKDPKRLENALATLGKSSAPLDEDLCAALRTRRVEQWVFLRNTTRHAIFLDSKWENAYAVLGLTGSIDRIVGGQSASFKAAVFQFKGSYVCDGIVEDLLFLGPGLRREANQALSIIKKSGRFHVRPGA